MKKIALFLLILVGFNLSLGISSAHAAFKDPTRIREAFAISGNTKLQLAADALGDDQLMQLFEELKKSPEAKEADFQKVLQKVK